MTSALDRFLEYVQIETTSSESSGTHPSTSCQFDLARLLVTQLTQLGLDDVALSPHALVTATLADNRSDDEQAAYPVPTLGMIAHLDTAPSASGKNVQPQVIHYESGPIRLSSGVEIPEDDALCACRGDTLVVTDGTTLLGADDKGGIAAIMTALDRLKNGVDADGKPYRHGKIRVAFTPDEEIGEGTLFFDVKKFGADRAVTVDGGMPPEINRETFSAEKAVLMIHGKDIHPGTAKGIMVNASILLADILSRLPKEFAPETTAGREPYVHPYQTGATVAEARAELILRSFDSDGMEQMRRALNEAIESVKRENPKGVIEVEYAEQYRNMNEKLAEVPEFLNQIEAAVRLSGCEPVWKAIRGGTDGASLTEMGLPTPNLFMGGHNFHSVVEWLSVEKLEIAVKTLVALAVLAADGGRTA